MAEDNLIEGRSCPLDYRYTPQDMAKTKACLSTSVLYVAGGLYGNPYALDAIERIVALEPQSQLIFNGDFHWFDVDSALFSSINQRVSQYFAITGNVEKELVRDEVIEVGCGCAYPDQVDQQVVDRSNRIHQRLYNELPDDLELRQWLKRLPHYRICDVAGRRVAIVHGDATSLAGWGFDAELMKRPEQRQIIANWLTTAEVDAFASTHTCQAACQRFSSGVVINNGAAGMPNFNDGCYGIITRIAEYPGTVPPLYSTQYNGLIYEALPVHYDNQAWQALFLSLWPEGSDAWQSYWQRIHLGGSKSPVICK